ncbi:hypothetical protein [Vibrio crassostreae]|jgi:hypothetical protein|uniref:hypothetical protein n=1 Tax=Vibrio crassostreae TaxID=246167 RepID=UPI00062F7D23|nr:hypothetical protein [Vibrio crassostreae]CDT76626.1 conserved hypothetical protein [Vibrio crassostreae]
MWTYVNNELDAQYSKPLPEVSRLKEGCLPIAEFELREQLVNWLFSGFVPANSLNWLDKLVNKSDFQNHLVALEQADKKLLDIVAEPRYMAALKRIVSEMPDSVEQKQYLIEKIINSGK